MTARWLVGALAAASLAAQVKLPPFTRTVLSNGMTVDLMPLDGVPLVNFRLLVRGGIASEPARLAGLADLTAEMLRKGTAKRSAEEFEEALDSLGGTLDIAPDQPLSGAMTFSAEFLSKDFDAGLDLLSDAALHPAFPESEFAKTVAARADEARQWKDNPQAALSRYFQAFFFGPGHPYGHPADETTLGRIRREDVAGYWRRFYVGRNMILAVAGRFDAARAREKIAAAFGGLAAGERFETARAARPAAGGRLLLVDKPDATQTYFIIGQPGIARDDPDRVKLLLVNTLFGGEFLSMLNEELRVNLGLTYGAASQVEMPRLPGAILIRTYTKTATTAQAIDASLEVLHRLAGNGISAERLATDRKSVV